VAHRRQRSELRVGGGAAAVKHYWNIFEVGGAAQAANRSRFENSSHFLTAPWL